MNLQKKDKLALMRKPYHQTSVAHHSSQKLYRHYIYPETTRSILLRTQQHGTPLLPPMHEGVPSTVLQHPSLTSSCEYASYCGVKIEIPAIKSETRIIENIVLTI